MYPYDEEDDEQQPLPGAAGATLGGAGALGGVGAPAPQTAVQSGSDFVPFNRLYDVNQGAAKSMVDGLINQTDADGAKVQSDLAGSQAQLARSTGLGGTEELASYGGPEGLPDADGLERRAEDIGSRLTQTGTQEGLQAQLGGSRVGGALANAAGHDRFGDLQQKYGGLLKSVEDARGQAAGSIGAYKNAYGAQEVARAADTKRLDDAYHQIDDEKERRKMDEANRRFAAANSMHDSMGTAGDIASVALTGGATLPVVAFKHSPWGKRFANWMAGK